MTAPLVAGTLYHGIRFPTKLEARWATFYDVLNIYWVYEPSFDALSSKRGLPYFWIPCPVFHIGAGFFIKIRPLIEQPDKDLLSAVENLALDTGHTCFVHYGDPGNYKRLEYDGVRGFVERKEFSLEMDLNLPIEQFLYGQGAMALDWDSLNRRIVEAVAVARRITFEE